MTWGEEVGDGLPLSREQERGSTLTLILSQDGRGDKRGGDGGYVMVFTG